jgi:ubiquinone/menaquinone biosynthesis C-methylase UbiE
VKTFDDPEREKWQQPEKVILALAIKPDQAIADIGAGTGYFAFRIAAAEPKCKIYAADIEQEMIDYMSKIATKKKVCNLIPTLISANSPNLPEKIDLVIVVDTYHHIDNRTKYFSQLRQLLRPGGRIAIIDFTAESPVGPPKQHRISKEEVIKELSLAGLKLDQDLKILPNQYFVIFRSMK